jgi:hypothetical protein
MRWSKLKQRIEERFADCARGRVEVWNTRYRSAHDQEGEGWITIDKKRVHSMGSVTYMVEFYERSARIQKERNCEDYRDASKRAEYLAVYDEANEQLREKEGVLPAWDFTDALFDYLNLSIEEILGSDRMIIRAIGMFDRRLGKRKLRSLDVANDHELVQNFYRIRCAFEGVELPSES